jgi:hypothetical protein
MSPFFRPCDFQEGLRPVRSDRSVARLAAAFRCFSYNDSNDTMATVPLAGSANSITLDVGWSILCKTSTFRLKFVAALISGHSTGERLRPSARLADARGPISPNEELIVTLSRRIAP